MILFSGAPGQVAFLPGNDVAQGGVRLVGLPDKKITFDSQRSIITAVGFKQSVNYQLRLALQSEVFIYVFGDLPGELVLSGLSFAEDCQTQSTQSKHGVEKMLRWYADNKISSGGKPVRVTIGDVALDGIVVSQTIEVNDPVTRLVQWSMPLVTLPERKR
jgi:hypothetical protein